MPGEQLSGERAVACKIKLCGLTRECDIECANALMPDYIGFVFAANSRRRVSPERAKALRQRLSPDVTSVGVFADEAPEVIAMLYGEGIIGVAQLHGKEDEDYIKRLREITAVPVWRAFSVKSTADIIAANASAADLILLDSGGGTGAAFDWRLIDGIKRPFILAGGLTQQNVAAAAESLRPYGVDASSCLETDGLKDAKKMAAFVAAVRGEDL